MGIKTTVLKWNFRNVASGARPSVHHWLPAFDQTGAELAQEQASEATVREDFDQQHAGEPDHGRAAIDQFSMLGEASLGGIRVIHFRFDRENVEFALFVFDSA
jgi:hypothetical protein